MRRYSSFLVCWWQTGTGEQRLSIRHVQSDVELTVTRVAEALEWMAARATAPDGAPPLAPPEPDPPPP